MKTRHQHSLCCAFLREGKNGLREGKRAEYNICIAGYYNAESLENAKFEGEAELLSVAALKNRNHSFSLNAAMSSPFSCSTAVKIFCLAVNAATI